MPVDSDGLWPHWRFFAVSYDVSATQHVHWYFGNSQQAAALDKGAANSDYNQGAIADPGLPLSFGNFGSGFHANDRLLRGKMYDPTVFSRALTQAEVVLVQNRSGCAPSCMNASCGTDGCGGSCGTW